MTAHKMGSDQDSNQKRQAYFKRRREVQRMQREGTRLEVSAMASPDLTRLLLAELALMEMDLGDGSSPRLYGRVLSIRAMVHELYERGDQMTLF